MRVGPDVERFTLHCCSLLPLRPEGRRQMLEYLFFKQFLGGVRWMDCVLRCCTTVVLFSFSFPILSASDLKRIAPLFTVFPQLFVPADRL